jgi:DNA-binding response OmpR family regulator
MSALETPRPRRILVVDDDHLVADTLALVFGRTGYEVRVRYTAETALDCARTFRPDLLLSDVSLPGGTDGFALIRQVSGLLPSCQVLIFTGSQPTSDTLRHQARTLPRPPAILTKPCPPTELLREIDALLACA